MLQGISFRQQAEYIKTKILADSHILALLAPRDRPELQEEIFNKFDALRGLLFNNKYDMSRAKARLDFEVLVKARLESGEIGPNPKNLRPDLKLSKEKAEARKAAGETIPEWYIRTDEEEAIVAKMKEEWEAAKNKI